MAHTVPRVRSESVLTLEMHAEHAAIRPVIESGEHHRVGATEGTPSRVDLSPVHSLQCAHVDDAGEREITEKRTRRTMNDVDVLNASGKQNRPIVVPFCVPVHGFVDWNAVDPECDVGCMI